MNKEKKEIVKKKQNPEEIKEEIRQASEFEKEELFDPNQIAALIDKSKEESAETLKKEKVDLVIVMVPGIYPDEVIKAVIKMDVVSDIAKLKDNKIEFI